MIRARQYQGALASWKSRDPLRFIDGPNLYRYIRNSPAQFIDPSGAELFLSNASDCNTVVNWIQKDLNVSTAKCVKLSSPRCASPLHFIALTPEQYKAGQKQFATGHDVNGEAWTSFEKQMYKALVGNDGAALTYHKMVSGNSIANFEFATLQRCQVDLMLKSLEPLHWSMKTISESYGKQLANIKFGHYGKFCGSFRQATCTETEFDSFFNRDKPIDAFDLACAIHDCCLVWDQPTFNLLMKVACHYCDDALCAAAENAESICANSLNAPLCVAYAYGTVLTSPFCHPTYHVPILPVAPHPSVNPLPGDIPADQ